MSATYDVLIEAARALWNDDATSTEARATLLDSARGALAVAGLPTNQMVCRGFATGVGVGKTMADEFGDSDLFGSFLTSFIALGEGWRP